MRGSTATTIQIVVETDLKAVTPYRMDRGCVLIEGWHVGPILLFIFLAVNICSAALITYRLRRMHHLQSRIIGLLLTNSNLKNWMETEGK